MATAHALASRGLAGG